jgi:hypothetical protein
LKAVPWQGVRLIESIKWYNQQIYFDKKYGDGGRKIRFKSQTQPTQTRPENHPETGAASHLPLHGLGLAAFKHST